ncbi:hypothetical protein [Spongiactinospora sp. TRM90649]|uniref:hypothetical protein n=1 Tax=Spongiactinospora sp. TRM90649 TaxID=3031114 RepID=UPI0023F93EC7|nr:hypothetical protein [Spongiactinospora sp. TRM90649]MDF5751390.1 hypothetical protein [Spongiactinospora sp. TRM90649]
MRIRSIRRLLVHALVMTALLVAAPLATSASASATTGGPEKCIFIADKADPNRKPKPLRKVCGNEKTVASAVADRSLLMTFYEHANFGGGSSGIYGDYGTCDAAGYTFDFSARYWGWALSSFRVHGRCWLTDYNDRWGTWSPTRAGPVPYVGDEWNDDIMTFKIRAQWI